MAQGTTLDGKPVQAGDFVTIAGSVKSVAMPNITISAYQSALSITALATDFNGPTLSGAGTVAAGPSVGDPVSGRGQVNSVSGSGPTASLTIQLSEKTVVAQTYDCYASQSL